MNEMMALLRSSVGRKLLMAVTGVMLLGYLAVLHLFSDLYLLQGREALNAYAARPKSSPLLWQARIALLVAFGLHAAVGISLSRANRAARSVGYLRGLEQPPTTWPSQSMLLGCGACVAACPNSPAMLFVGAKTVTSLACPRASPSD